MLWPSCMALSFILFLVIAEAHQEKDFVASGKGAVLRIF